jgi:hypothetical protein
MAAAMPTSMAELLRAANVEQHASVFAEQDIEISELVVHLQRHRSSGMDEFLTKLGVRNASRASR